MKLLLASLLACALAGYLTDLGGSSIWDANEAYYVETPREMIESGDYLRPAFNYEPRFNKPVLSYWIVAALYHVFGVSVTVERAATTAAVLVIILAAYLLTRALSSHPLAPLLAAAGLAANPRVFMFARRIFVDMLLAAFMTLVLLFFALAERYPHRRRALLAAMYVCAGLGVLAKGPVAAVLPALVFVAYLAVYGELSRIRTMMVPAGALIVLAIVAPWYVALYLDSGWTHIREFFVDENLGRFTQLIGPQSRGPWFYLPVVLTDMFPWSFVLPVAVAVWLRDRRSAPVEPGVRLRTLLLLWTLTIVCVFSFSTTKQDLYIFPIVAAVAALGGDVVARLAATGESPRRWLVVMTVAAGLLLVTVGALALYLFAHAETVYAIAGVRWAAGATIAGGAIAAVLARRRPLCAMLVVLAVLVAVDWTLVVRALPSFERYKPVVPFSEAILREARQGDRVVHYDVALPSMVFYLRRHVETLFAPEELLGVMQDSRDVLAVMPEHRYQELAGKFGRPTCVMLRRATFDAKLREMLSGREPPALLLVATRCPP